MKKPITNKGPVKKSDKTKDSGELRKPTKLKPLKEKEKKSWKNNLDEDDEDFAIEDPDIKLTGSFDDDDDEEEFFDDSF